MPPVQSKAKGSWHPNTLVADESTGTFEFQAALPRLPVPPVKQTIAAYLRSRGTRCETHIDDWWFAFERREDTVAFAAEVVPSGLFGA